MKPESPKQTTLRDQAVSLYLKHYSLIRLVAFEAAPSRDLVDDIVNDSFVAFVSTPEKWDYSRPIQPLLRTITRNIALQYWKKRVNSLSQPMQELGEILRARYEAESCSERGLELSDKLRALENCLDKLTEEQRRLLNEHYVEEKSFVELGAKYNKRPNTLQKTVSRLRIALEKCVQAALRLLDGSLS
ncbi:MAG: sigma-70 family RNA polymerase sigma factor [Planctomycetia bacterium]|nr:sigma-70 family RNA polymerase sigma factor [Planctomycetia bacterium]